ncbi:MAG: Maf family protein [Burkholderiales bacterium]
MIVYLVSASPRRRELLRQIGIHFQTLLLRSSPDRGLEVDETPISGESVEDYVRRIAIAKANAGWRCMGERRLPFHPVLAADTAVSLDGKIIGKPKSLDEASTILRSLSGREHEVLTAVACTFEEKMEVEVSRTKVRFSKLLDREILDYIAAGESMDKAGGYAIQGKAARFIERIEGSYSGVMGLPLFETGQVLGRIGYD